jgi:ADP-ribose pyrophosphatase
MGKPRAKSVELIERETPYQGYFRIDRVTLRHELFAGGMSEPLTREVFERGHAAAVLPYDPERDAVVLIEQFRIGAYAAGRDPWLIEIVAGIVEDGETPRDVALRELGEEAGLTADLVEPIGEVMLSPGGTSETIALLCARADASGANGIHGLADEHEDIRVTAVPFADALAAVERGDVVSAPAIIALQWLALNRDRLRERWRR